MQCDVRRYALVFKAGYDILEDTGEATSLAELDEMKEGTPATLMPGS
jgi:hypothetical protein